MDPLLPALVARRFYLDGLSKVEIAAELGVSRFRVARLLEAALREGIVRIEIAVPPEVDADLSARLADSFGLRQAVVIRAGGSSTDDELHARLGRACAAMLAETLTADDVLGISWGRTLHAMVGALPPLPACRVVQLVGTVPTVDLAVNSMDLLRRFAEVTGGPVDALHVPLAVDDADVAARLRQESFVRRTFATYSTITHAVVGVGAWGLGGSSLRDALPPSLVERAEAAGAVADICCLVLDGAGHDLLDDELAAHCIAITAAQLRAVPDVLAVAGGEAKGAALVAAARSGLIDRLITDDAAARMMLAEASSSD